MDWIEFVHDLPEGYSEGWFSGKKYGISLKLFAGGRSCKVFAEELGGKDFISFNAYQLDGHWHLKPCEMPREKVMNFLAGVRSDYPC